MNKKYLNTFISAVVVILGVTLYLESKQSIVISNHEELKCNPPKN
jgi:hypothetical protein